MNSLLFLDIDGVLNSTRYWSANKPLPMGKAGALDPEAVERLNRIVDETGCDVVLSSSWRSQGRDVVDVMLRERGFRHHLDGLTPLLWKERRIEIGQEVDRRDPERFVVIDDDLDAWADSFRGWGVFVNTNYLVGLQDDGVAMAIQWLNNGESS